jgi:hypothetical protein
MLPLLLAGVVLIALLGDQASSLTPAARMPSTASITLP